MLLFSYSMSIKLIIYKGLNLDSRPSQLLPMYVVTYQSLKPVVHISSGQLQAFGCALSAGNDEFWRKAVSKYM